MPTQDFSPQINEAFNLLRKGLRPFVEEQMKTIYGDRWYDECHHADVHSNREGKYTWDIQALLKVVTNVIFWRDVFAMAKRRGPEERGIFITLLELRHEVDAHRDKDMPKQEALRVIRYIVSALRCIDAKEQVEEAEGILHALSPQPVTPSASHYTTVASTNKDKVLADAAPVTDENQSSHVTNATIANPSDEIKPTQPTRLVDFWGAHNFDFADALNEEIWQLSPVVQQEI